jgi:hypothetical protein
MEYTGDYINNVLHMCPRGKYTLLRVIFLQYSRLTAQVLKEYNPSKGVLSPLANCSVTLFIVICLQCKGLQPFVGRALL